MRCEKYGINVTGCSKQPMVQDDAVCEICLKHGLKGISSKKGVLEYGLEKYLSVIGVKPTQNRVKTYSKLANRRAS